MSIHEDLTATVHKLIELNESKKITRCALPLTDTNYTVLNWLDHQNFDEKIYLSDRNDRLEMASVGIADEIHHKTEQRYDDVYGQIQDRFAETNGDIKYFGGFSFFQTDSFPEHWQSFRGSRFILPVFELQRVKETGLTILFTNIVKQDTVEETLKKYDALIQLLVFSISETAPLNLKLLDRQDCPDKEQWLKSIHTVHEHLSNSDLNKVVLARESDFEFDADIPILSLMSELKSISPDCFHFIMQTDSKHAFIGATPEMLYYRKENQIQGEALAGTRARSNDPDKDNDLYDELLSSEKDRREHRYVFEQLNEHFESLCIKSKADAEPFILKLTHLQHFKQNISGILKESSTDDRLLKTLHPTPAVGGSPTNLALELIQELEDFDRGWYAAPFGWFGTDGAGFGVAIRSGLITGRHLKLYSGAGIVEGSDPHEEWQEIENKIAGFKSIFE
ncbi:MAG: isochorismate synthase [Lentisphaeria bacterium]|nr:isochorismate synthase [Lentisphaeria bacterium]NQZ71116.1 isochorismate synthase [Lentisphaeria bacterium]